MKFPVTLILLWMILSAPVAPNEFSIRLPAEFTHTYLASATPVVEETQWPDHDERNLLEHLVMAEAGGEPYEAQLLVAQCVLDRVDHPSFPGTIEGVIYQPRQFTPASTGALWRRTPTASVRQAVASVLDEGHRQSAHPVLYFMAEKYVSSSRTRNWFYNNLTQIDEVGNTQFFTERIE